MKFVNTDVLLFCFVKLFPRYFTLVIVLKLITRSCSRILWMQYAQFLFHELIKFYIFLYCTQVKQQPFSFKIKNIRWCIQTLTTSFPITLGNVRNFVGTEIIWVIRQLNIMEAVTAYSIRLVVRFLWLISRNITVLMKGYLLNCH